VPLVSFVTGGVGYSQPGCYCRWIPLNLQLDSKPREEFQNAKSLRHEFDRWAGGSIGLAIRGIEVAVKRIVAVLGIEANFDIVFPPSAAGHGPVRDDSTEVIEDRCSDLHQCAKFAGLAGRRLTPTSPYHGLVEITPVSLLSQGVKCAPGSSPREKRRLHTAKNKRSYKRHHAKHLATPSLTYRPDVGPLGGASSLF
jgi:hypothetical protein